MALDIKTLLAVHRTLRTAKKDAIRAILDNAEYTQFMRDEAARLVELVYDAAITEVDILIDRTDFERHG